MRQIIGSSLRAYGFALAVSIFAIVLTRLLLPLMERNLFLLFLAAVTISTWYGGPGPGLLSTLTAIFAADLFFLHPFPSYLSPNLEDFQRLSIFVLVAVTIVSLGAARRRSEERRIRLAAIVESSDDAIIGKKLDGTIESWNKGAQQIYGYSAEEVKGHSILMIVPPDRQEEILRILEQIQRGEQVSHFESVRLRKDGQPIDISLSVSPIKDSDGKIIGASAIGRDITARKHAELERRKSDERFQLVARVTNDAVWDRDLMTNEVWWNQGLQTLFGYSDDGIRSYTWWIDHLHSEDRKAILEKLEACIQEGRQFWQAEYRFRRADDSYAYVLDRGYILKNENDQPVRMIGALMDITDRVQAQQLLERRVADRTRELSTLYAVTAVASASLDLTITLHHSLNHILAALGTDMGFIHLLDETGNLLRMSAEHGLPQEMIVQTNTMPTTSGGSGWVMEHDEPLVVPDITGDPRTVALAEALGSKAYICVPIRAKGKVVGVLSIVRETSRPASADEIALLIAVGDQLGVSVELARLFKEAQGKATREERERLARELHDSVTQALYSLTLLTEATRRAAGTGDLPQVLSYLTRLGEIAHQSLKEMRLLVYQLRPAALEKEGLIGALQQRLEAVEKRAGIEARLLVEGTSVIPANIEEDFFRIAQEALNNTLKHASAKSVAVKLHLDAQQTQLEIIDNGIGFDLENVRDGGGMGLRSMNERAAKLGATLTVLSTPGNGTRIVVELKHKKSAPTSL
jgi:PAS domain S-box-containing protein